LRLRGEIAARRDPLDINDVETSFAAAMALAEARGMRPLLAHCQLGLGRAHRRVGEMARAREETAAALSEYRAMDMAYWRARAEAELASPG